MGVTKIEDPAFADFVERTEPRLRRAFVVPRQGVEVSDEVGGFGRSASRSCPTSSTCVAATAFVARRAVAVFRTEDGGASWTEHHIARAMNLYAGVSCPDPRPGG